MIMLSTSTTARLPTTAAIGIPHCMLPVNPSVIPATAPTAPPADTPVMPGSASGLRNTVCITTPTPASAPPTIIATTTRGKRIDHTTVRIRSDADENTVCSASTGLMRMVPNERLRAAKTTSTTTAKAIKTHGFTRLEAGILGVDAGGGVAVCNGGVDVVGRRAP